MAVAAAFVQEMNIHDHAAVRALCPEPTTDGDVLCDPDWYVWIRMDQLGAVGPDATGTLTGIVHVRGLFSGLARDGEPVGENGEWG